MKKLFSLLAMLTAIVLTAGAQSMQVATLSHDGTITSYTSADALRRAYEAAVDGDVITLSSGVFNSVNLEKRITVRGAGMGIKVNDTDPYLEPTVIKGNFSIWAGGNSEANFKMEGILCQDEMWLGDVSDAMFTKCKFKDMHSHTGGNSASRNVTFINCSIDVKVYCQFSTRTTMNFYNCYLKNSELWIDSSDSIILTNCIVEFDKSYLRGMDDYVFKNSVIVHNNSYTYTLSCLAYNTIHMGEIASDCNFVKTLGENNNTLLPAGTQLFKEETFYQLTEEAKQYLGTDGTEVGIYGGSLPFDPTPTNPQIVKFNVAPKTTLDGKLSIDIEVYAK